MFQSRTEEGNPINIPSSFNGYKIVDLIDTGSSSIIVLVENQSTHERFAAKIIPKEYGINDNKIEYVNNEIKILKTLSHPNIIKYIDSFEIKNNDKEFIVLITEYCEKGNLLSYIENENALNENMKKKIIRELLSGVQYLHEKGISHGDIKVENILLNSDFTVKLCDFGFSRTLIVVGDDYKNGTLYYAAPELFYKGYFNALKADIYAIGITLYSFFELQFPYKGENDEEIIQQIIKGQLTYNENMNNNLKKLIQQCTNMNPQLRPSIENILNNEYLSIKLQPEEKIDVHKFEKVNNSL